MLTAPKINNIINTTRKEYDSIYKTIKEPESNLKSIELKLDLDLDSELNKFKIPDTYTDIDIVDTELNEFKIPDTYTDTDTENINLSFYD